MSKRIVIDPITRIEGHLRIDCEVDGGKVTSVQIAMNKAFTAAGHRKPTHHYKNAHPGEEAFGIFTQHEGRFTVFVGGFPIFVDGQCVGSIAASGGNGEQDIACCEAGIEKVVYTSTVGTIGMRADGAPAESPLPVGEI